MPEAIGAVAPCMQEVNTSAGGCRGIVSMVWLGVKHSAKIVSQLNVQGKEVWKGHVEGRGTLQLRKRWWTNLLQARVI